MVHMISGRDEWVSGRLHRSLKKAAQISRMLIARLFVLTAGWDYNHKG
jgi:hypothetical protein